MADQAYEASQYQQESSNGNYHQGEVLDDSDDDEDTRKLFVGGLSSDTTEEDLKSHFGTYGEINHAVVKYDKMSGASRGFGFITFAKNTDMKKSLNQEEHIIKNKKIDPKQAQPTKEPAKKVFVGGVPIEASEDQIRDYFKQFGRIEKVDMPFDTSKSQRKPFVFISFHSEKGAKRAIAEEKQNVFGKTVDVRVAQVKQPQQRQSFNRFNQYDGSADGGYGGYGYMGYGQQPGYDQAYQQYDPSYQQAGYGGYQGYPQYQGYAGYGQQPQQGYQQGGQANNSRGGGKVRGGGRGGSFHPYPRQQ